MHNSHRLAAMGIALAGTLTFAGVAAAAGHPGTRGGFFLRPLRSCGPGGDSGRRGPAPVRLTGRGSPAGLGAGRKTPWPETQTRHRRERGPTVLVINPVAAMPTG